LKIIDNDGFPQPLWISKRQIFFFPFMLTQGDARCFETEKIVHCYFNIAKIPEKEKILYKNVSTR